MKNTMRNLTLSAAALAALMAVAPQASAQEHGRGRGFNGPRQELRERGGRREERGPGYRGYGGYGSYGRYGHYGRTYVAPVRPYVRFGYAAPFRIFSGFRFYASSPGPGYVYIPGYGWVVPPFFGAVWVPAHYDIDGYWVEGFWR